MQVLITSGDITWNEIKNYLLAYQIRSRLIFNSVTHVENLDIFLENVLKAISHRNVINVETKVILLATVWMRHHRRTMLLA